MTKRSTAIFIITATFLLAAFDVYLAVDSFSGNTYSSVIREWGVQWQWLPYLVAGVFGLLITHWFAKRNKDGNLETKEKALMMALMTIVFGAGMGVGLFW